MTRPLLALAGLVLALTSCSGGSADPEPTGSGSPTASSSGSAAADDGRASVAAYGDLLTATFSGNQDLDDRAAALVQDGVREPAAVVRRLNAAAEREGLTFRVRSVDATDPSDITCYVSTDDGGPWLSSPPTGPDSATLALGEGDPVCDDASARYVLTLAAAGSGVTVTASDASEDADGARRLAEVAQGLVDQALAEG